MNWGMKNRMSQIINPKSHRTVMLAIDHGYFQGPTTGLKDPGKTVEPLLSFADSLMLTRGALRNWIDPDMNTPIILRMSGGASILKELSNEVLTTSIEDALRANVAAITCSVFIGGEYENQTINNLSKLVNAGERYSIPVLAVTAVGKDMARDARYLGLASRICVEQGAHMVKTYYCEEDFESIVEACGNVPMVIAGGKKQPEKDALTMAFNAVSKGASGVDMGRNIFQSDCPVGMIKAVRSVVHDSNSVEDAFAIYESEKK